MSRIAIFAGTFDPIHLGHMNIIRRSLNIADKLIIALGDNILKHKNQYSSLDLRLANIHSAIDNDQELDYNNISITHYSGALVDFVSNVKENSHNDSFFLIRGVRNAKDLESEQNIAHYNAQLLGIDTVFLPTDDSLKYISSSNIRELISIGKSEFARTLLPKGVKID